MIDNDSKLMFLPAPLATGTLYAEDEATEPIEVQAITVTVSLADGTHAERALVRESTGWWLRES